MLTTHAQVKIGQSGTWLAYTLQTGGSEASSGHVSNLKTGHALSAGELPLVVSIEWLQDGSSLLYTVPDTDGRPHKVRTMRGGVVSVPALQFLMCACGRGLRQHECSRMIRATRLPRCAGDGETPHHTGPGRVRAGGA